MYVHRICGEHYTAWVKEEMTDNSSTNITMEIEKCWNQYAQLLGRGYCKNKYTNRTLYCKQEGMSETVVHGWEFCD